MKILSVLTYYHPHWTGLTGIATRLAEGLAARGHEVTVLTARHEPSLPATETRGGVRIVRLWPMAFVSRGVLLPTFPFRAAAMVRASDIVQIHTPLAESAFVAALCRLARKPLLMTHHGDLVMPAGMFNRLVQRVVTTQMSAAGRVASVITTLSADYTEHSAFLRQFGTKVRAIPPSVAMPPPDAAAAAGWRRSLGLEGKRIVGFAGRFVEEKGFDVLLRAIPDLLAREPGAHFVYAGEHRVIYEQFYDRCRPLLAPYGDRVTFVGLLRGAQRLADFYAMCDVFVLPSRTDCFAVVQLEAMLSGTPVVASDIPGAREAVARSGMGMLVAPDDPTGLAAGIAGVLRDRDRFVRPREAIGALFDPERSLATYEQVMLAMLERR